MRGGQARQQKTGRWSVFRTVFFLLICGGLSLVCARSGRAAEPGTSDSESSAEVFLWEGQAPEAKGSAPQDRPRIWIYRPAQADPKHAAVVVCPGGGYGGLALGHEGEDIGRWLRHAGTTAVVLDYRHRGKGYGHPVPMLDGQRALRWTRSHAAELGIDPQRIGVLGFSAGGHLASTLATHFDEGNASASDPIDRVSCRPDFAVLCYPVIAFNQPFTHVGSQQNLLGKEPSAELVQLMSNELQVTPQTPPTFLFHTTEDQAVPVENSLVFYGALVKHRVPAELHVFQQGQHGVGLARQIPGARRWPGLCLDWLQRLGMLEHLPAEE